ncbi:hypothetical protein C8A01DRAFT_12522, partial [Parachaetomium inaequale]
GVSLGGWVRGVKRGAEGQQREGRGGRYGKGVGGVGRGGMGEGILIPTRDGEAGDGVRMVQSSASSSSSGALGRFAQASLVWEAVLGLLTAMVECVRMDDEMFDDILGLVVDVLPQHADLKEALETVNADAVWLALYERGMVPGREVPVVEGFEFRFASVEARGAVQVGV